jgi:hypothetical protein
MLPSLRHVWNGSSTVRYPFLCALTCTLPKEVQLFPGLGLYSGIFAMYLQCPPNKSRSTGRTASIIFYALCLLYVLSTTSAVVDLVAIIQFILASVEVSNNSICKNIIFLSVVQTYPNSQSQIDAESYQFHLQIIQTTVNGCCDFLAQCILVRINHCTYHPFYSPKSSKIYRCWIVWGQNIRVVIVPSILAIIYLGQSIRVDSPSHHWHDFKLISRFQFITSSYLASARGRHNICTRPIFGHFLGGPDGSNKLRSVHGR